MAKFLINLTSTGLVIGGLTWDFAKTISAGAVVSTTGSALTELADGLYILSNPNVTQDTAFRVHVTADATKADYGVFVGSAGTNLVNTPIPSAGGSFCAVSAGLLFGSIVDPNPQAWAEIVELPYEVGGTFYRGARIKAVYDSDSSTWGWQLPQGAVVHFEAADYGINITAQIPATGSVLLSALQGGL
jgi:hypothetical protein